MSGLGKGLTTASISKILQSMGYSVMPVKIDPYVNIDAGTMSPFEHGEVFVLDDGGEVDLDLGNYERFLDISLSRQNNITTGKVYKNVIERERKGDYLGKTVQIIPHVTDEIKHIIKSHSNGIDFVLIEVGGTVGDIESMPFLEVARQLANEEDVFFIHVVPIVQMHVVGEQKTKPAQHSVRELMSSGIKPDMLVCRTTTPLRSEVKKKLSLFCNIQEQAVIENVDVEDIHLLPIALESQYAGDLILTKFGLFNKSDLTQWKTVIGGGYTAEVDIALVGKYTKLHDSYISVLEALKHAGYKTKTKVNVHWVESESLTREHCNRYDGILVPGGFGPRGAEGKIEAIACARENNIPFLGLCYGFQLAVVEYARFSGIDDAVSSEFETQGTCVIDFLESQRDIEIMGASMRLGKSEIILKEGTCAHSLYGTKTIMERHRHRLEVVHEHIPVLEGNGGCFSGSSPDGRMEIFEIPSHPFFLGTQFHPEFKSRVESPAPVFVGFVDAARTLRQERS